MHAGKACDGWFEATADHSRIRGLMALAGERNRKLANPTGAVSLLQPTFGTKFFHPLGRKGFRDRHRRISDYSQVCMASTTGFTVESSKTAAQFSAVTYVR